MEKDSGKGNTKQSEADAGNYTIFHAIVETMTKKRDKDSRRRRFLRKIGLSK